MITLLMWGLGANIRSFLNHLIYIYINPFAIPTLFDKLSMTLMYSFSIRPFVRAILKASQCDNYGLVGNIFGTAKCLEPPKICLALFLFGCGMRNDTE